VIGIANHRWILLGWRKGVNQAVAVTDIELTRGQQGRRSTIVAMILMIVLIVAAAIFVASFVYDRLRRRQLRRLAESSHSNAARLANPTGGLEKNLASEVLLRSDGNP
jgi:1,2-phenylacetyl-CoA epoxidase catalytic subunit